MNDAVQACPAKPDQLAVRLGVADKEDAAPRALSTRLRYETTPTAEVDWDAKLKREDTYCLQRPY